MISIDVEFLTGRYVATRYNDRSDAEWPPEPARLFSACVATLYENLDLGPSARAALEWLEELPAPWIVASNAAKRSVARVFVPVNDTRVLGKWETALDALREAEVQAAESRDVRTASRGEELVAKAQRKLAQAVKRVIEDDGKRDKDPVLAAAQMLPDRRGRQPRTFPSVTPECPRVSFVWPDAEPEETVKVALATLLSRVTRLGHPSSLVVCRLGDGSEAMERTDDTWYPDDRGGTSFRVVSKGQLERLDRAYELHRGVEPRVLPSTFQGYRRGAPSEAHDSVPHTVFGQDWIVFRAVPMEGGSRPPRLQLTRGPDLARALRGALLKHADAPPHELLSGHDASGAPLSRPHVAFVPLADVGSKYATGAILGVAVVLPREIPEDARRAILRAIARCEASGGNGRFKVWMGRAGELWLERVVDQDPRTTVQPSTWCRRARRWASVTAVALDRNPGDLRSNVPAKAALATAEAERIVTEACARIGLSEPPAWVQVMHRSLFDAAPKADSFMPFPRRAGALRRVCVHVELAFEREIEGPVLLGAGRYFGLGLLRPRAEDAA